MITHPCSICGTPKIVSPVPCDACRPAAELAEQQRLAAIANAGWKGSAEDVTPDKLAEFGFIAHYEATPEKLAAPDAQAAKAAHDEALAQDLPPEKAKEIAAAVRVDPEKATLLLTAAVAAQVDEALAKVAEASADAKP